MSKFFGFLLGVVVALAGPAVFGVLAADGGIELNAKEMALAYGIGALIFWAVVSYFSGAAALGAAVVFGVMIYTVHWIPNRMTNFLNDVPGVTTGMIEGVKQYTLNGVVPILAAISLVYGIQSIVRSVQRRRRERAEADRAQRAQELAQAQQAAEVAAPYAAPAAYAAAAPYPVAEGDYQPAENRFSGYGNTSYEDLFDEEEEPAPVQPRNQADEQTAMFATAAAEPYADEDRQPDTDDDTRLVPTDGDETVMVPTASSEDQAPDEDDSAAQAADEVTVQAEKPAAQEETVAEAHEPVAQGDDPADDETQLTPTSTTAAPAPPAAAAEAGTPVPAASTPAATAPDAGTPAPPAPATPEEPTAVTPVEPTAATPAAPAEPTAETPAAPSQPSASAPASPTPSAPAQPSADEPTRAGNNSTPAESSRQAAAGPVSTADPAPVVRAETVGQQYRERMDGPDEDETGEHHFGAFENPMQSAEARPQAPRVMDLPGQFRPAGT